MSAEHDLPKPEPVLRVWHFQALCGLCLGIVFLAQLSQGIVLTNLLCVLLGALGIVSRLRWGIFLFLVGIVFAQSIHYYTVERLALSLRRAGRLLDIDDFLLAAGALGYVAGQHRLQGIWHYLWPPDPRERRGAPRPTFLWMRRRPPIVTHRRGEIHLRAAEMVNLALLVLPLALAGMALYMAARPQRFWLGFPLSLGHFVILLWIFLLAAWLVRSFLQIWRAWMHDEREASAFLRDQLWTQTRGEQRRVARWRVWAKLDARARGKP